MEWKREQVSWVLGELARDAVSSRFLEEIRLAGVIVCVSMSLTHGDLLQYNVSRKVVRTRRRGGECS